MEDDLRSPRITINNIAKKKTKKQFFTLGKQKQVHTNKERETEKERENE